MSVQHAYRAGGVRSPRPGWRITFDYEPVLVEQLKALVPAADREWLPDRKEWWIAVEWEERLAALLPGFEAFLQQAQLF